MNANGPIPMKDTRIAMAMVNAPLGRPELAIGRVTDLTEKAQAQGAAIVCFPELNLTGYSTRKKLTPLSRSDSRLKRLEALAADTGVTILAGMAEKGENGHVHASHLAIPPNGPSGIYRKLHLAPPEQPVFSAGSEIPLFEAAGIRFGIQLCYDAHFPELATRMALGGAHLIFIPHASPRGGCEKKYHSWMRHLSARAYDNSVFIAACNQCGENGAGLTFPGIAVVIGPDGEVLERDTTGEEGILLADLKEKDFSAVRNHRMRFFLPNRREELFPLS